MEDRRRGPVLDVAKKVVTHQSWSRRQSSQSPRSTDNFRCEARADLRTFDAEGVRMSMRNAWGKVDWVPEVT